MEATKEVAAPVTQPSKGKGEPSANGKPGKGDKAQSPAPAIAPVEAPKVAAVKPGPHEPSGEQCKLPHAPQGDDPGGPCERCKHCGKKYRPHEMKQLCESRV